MTEPLTRTMSNQLTTRLQDWSLAGTDAPGNQLIFKVRSLFGAELEDVFRLRPQIEPPVVAEGTRRARCADREAARAARQKLDEALAADELAKSGALNWAFLLALIVRKLQPVTSAILGRLHVLAQRYVQVHLILRGRVKWATREHTALFEAREAGKTKEAGRLTQLHIEGARDHLAHYLDPAK